MNQDSRAETDAIIKEINERHKVLGGMDLAIKLADPSCEFCGSVLSGAHNADCVTLNDEYREPGARVSRKNSKVKKFDAGKPDLSYLMDAPLAMAGFALVMKTGETKYGRSNWKLHNDPNRLIAALLRHLMAWQNGEKIDPDSNLSHLHHVVANAAMLAENFTLNNQEHDNDQEN